MSVDLLIKNGTIIDGTGRLRHKADLGIDHGKIETIGRLDEAGAGRVIDGSGLVVAPGFIDMHSHADEWIALNRDLFDSWLAQARQAPK